MISESQNVEIWLHAKLIYFYGNGIFPLDIVEGDKVVINVHAPQVVNNIVGVNNNVLFSPHDLKWENIWKMSIELVKPY